MAPGHFKPRDRDAERGGRQRQQAEFRLSPAEVGSMCQPAANANGQTVQAAEEGPSDLLRDLLRLLVLRNGRRDVMAGPGRTRLCRVRWLAACEIIGAGRLGSLGRVARGPSVAALQEQ